MKNMGTAEESLCPQCSEKGQKNRVVAVFYKSQNALYTCEDKTCTYFVTDLSGNLVKFDKESNTTSYILDRPPTQHDSVDDELDNFFDSLDNNFQNTNNTLPYSAQPTVQAPVNPSNGKNSNTEVKNENNNPAGNLKLEEVYEIDCSSLNLDDFLLYN